MIVTSASVAGGRKPPPLWVVTNGDKSVGPINTTLLVKGFGEGRVTPECYVRDLRGLIWRPVGAVREVRAYESLLYRRRGAGEPVRRATTLSALISLCESTRETLALGLELAVERTGSAVGLLHTFERDAAVTRGAAGAVDPDAVGRPVRSEDPVARMAIARSIVLGDPRRDAELAGVAARLGGVETLAGVAMVPIVGERGVIGMIELGRSDHGFRTSDAVVLREVAQTIVRRMDEIG